MSEHAPTQFNETMVTILNHGALNLAIGIGYRLGLFEVMDAWEAPRSSAELAREAGLHERYVREWLGAMTAGGIVTCLPSGAQANQEERFLLPKEHGDVLAQRAGSANLGVYAQEIPLLTSLAFQEVLEGFKNGEGVSPDRYPAFQDFMGQLAAAKYRADLLKKFVPSIENGALQKQLTQGADVCDLGCGKGEALLLMAEAFPSSRFTGIDVSPAAIAAAKDSLAQKGCKNARFLVQDAAALAEDTCLHSCFDYILAFDAIHDQQEPQKALAAAQAMLRPGGSFSMVDIAAKSNLADNANHPLGAFLYTISLMHCLPVGLYQNGAGLGMMWGREKAMQMLKKAGFSQVTLLEMDFDPFNDHFFCKK